MTDEREIMKEREALKKDFKKCRNDSEREKLATRDEALRLSLSSIYVQQDPNHARQRQEALRKLEDFKRFGNTFGRR